MRVTRKKRDERPLAEFPGWGLEIMMGLYGEQQVRDALAAESADDAPQQAAADATPADGHTSPTGATEAIEFDAVSSMFDRVRRLRRR